MRPQGYVHKSLTLIIYQGERVTRPMSNKTETRNKLNQIHWKLWRKAQETGHIPDEIESEHIEDIIIDVAGYDPRTVEKYRDLIEEHDIINTEFGEDNIKVEEPDFSVKISEDLGPTTAKRMDIPKKVSKIIDELGLSRSFLVTKAALEEADLMKEVASEMYPEREREEVELAMVFLVHNLHEMGSKEAQSRRELMMREMYEKYTGKQVKSHDKLLEIRDLARDLAVDLGIENPQPL